MSIPLQIPLDEIEFTFVRSSGAGGQNVNKVNSKAVLRWSVLGSTALTFRSREKILRKLASIINSEGELLVQSDRFRDQGRNRADCLEKLAALLAQALHEPKTRVPTRPTYGSKQRRLNAKKSRGDTKKQRRQGFDD